MILQTHCLKHTISTDVKPHCLFMTEPIEILQNTCNHSNVKSPLFIDDTELIETQHNTCKHSNIKPHCLVMTQNL